MIRLHNARKRIEDLASWPTEELKRRLKFEADVRKALRDLGCRSGTQGNFLSLDITVIGRILRKRGVTEA